MKGQIMNAERRKQIDTIMSILENMRNNIESVRDSEEVAYDNLPESLQNSDKGEKSQAAMTAMDSAAMDIDNAIDNLLEAQT